MAPLLSTNCYLVVDEDRSCVVVDPGGGAADQLRDVVAADRLTPLAVVLTHGHVDHTWSAAQISHEFSVPVWIHADDAYRLADPLGTLGPLGAELAELADEGALGSPAAPERVATFTTGSMAQVAGLAAMHAPGHTQGSTVYLLSEPSIAFTGDVLFAGSIGRTDLPGGDDRAMGATLRGLADLDPATVVLPGHGPASTVGVELETNPYLRAVSAS